MTIRKEVKVVGLIVVLVLGFYFLAVSLVFALEPDGADATEIKTEHGPNHSADNHSALAGNVTEINLYGSSITQAWQGYFGNVTGTIQLADATNNVMYNWTVASPQGEVYASTNSSIIWDNIMCLNFTATGVHTNENGNGGTTSRFGLNHTQVEVMYNIIHAPGSFNNSVDGLNETFLYGADGIAGGHETFFTASKQFGQGECRTTRVFDSSGTGVDNNFEEVILYEPSTTSIVFTSILENNLLGFDQRTHDFEMLVLEDGHGTNVAPTQYYFFVELE